MIAITAATGQFGRLVIEKLLEKGLPPSSLAAIVRNPAKAGELSARGIQVRQADYTDRETLTAAFGDVQRLLLISSSEVGQRVAQHGNVIEAAKQAGMKELLYTSVLHADTSSLILAEEHLATERLIAESGLPSVILRNGWYSENYTASIPAALSNGALVGSAGDGRIASAARADYAEAAAVLLAKSTFDAGQVLELAGDESYTLSDLAAEISRQVGKTIPYRDLPEADYRAILLSSGLPEPVAALLARCDVDASHGALFDGGRQLSRLIGRPSTPLAVSVKNALQG
jgi:NAD(P)H dehydrogenase (quinone)